MFAVKDDVIVNGRVLIVAGTPVMGRVAEAKGGRSWGRSGSLDIEAGSIVEPYGLQSSL